MTYIFNITPVTKPRQTRSDVWKKRPCVMRYRAFADELRLLAKAKNFTIPACGYHVTFVIPMPDSWSKQKKEEMRGRGHQQKPDKDNLEKAFLDALCEDDSYVWDGRATKVWGVTGAIIVEEI